MSEQASKQASTGLLLAGAGWWACSGYLENGEYLVGRCTSPRRVMVGTQHSGRVSRRCVSVGRRPEVYEYTLK